MSIYIATVIKTGNSYALRVPKAYIENARLNLGDKADLLLPKKHKKQDHGLIQELWKELQAIKPFQSIKNPSDWQREMRKDRPLPGRN